MRVKTEAVGIRREDLVLALCVRRCVQQVIPVGIKMTLRTPSESVGISKYRLRKRRHQATKRSALGDRCEENGTVSGQT